MNAARCDTRPCDRVRWREAALVLGLLAVMAIAADAAPIRSRVLRDPSWISRPVSARFVGQLMQLGEARVAAALRLRAVNGLLPEGPIVDYLRWRRGLKPAR